MDGVLFAVSAYADNNAVFVALTSFLAAARAAGATAASSLFDDVDQSSTYF